MSVRKNILKNGIASLFQKVIKVAEQLLLIPFFIKYWGPAYYGEWLTLTIIPSVLALSHLGFGSAAANTFLLKYASGNKQGAADTAKTGVRLLSCLVGASILLSVIVLLILSHFKFLEKSLIQPDDAFLGVIALLISKIINFYQPLFEAHFRAARRASLSIYFSSLISLINIIAGIIVLSAGGKVLQYALVSLFISIIINPVYIITAEKVLGLNKEHKGIVKKSEIRYLVHKGFGYFLSPVWQAIYFQGCTFIVRLILGPVAVTIFNTVRTIIRSSSQAFEMLIIAVYPDFQFEMGAGNYQKARRIFLGVLGANILLAIVFVLGLGLFGNQLYDLWTHKALNVPFNVWMIFITSILFYALWFTFSFVFEALNKPYTYTLAGLLCAVIAVGLSCYFCYYLGLAGAALGNLSFDILMCLYLVPKGAATLKMRVGEIVLTVLKTPKVLFFEFKK